MGVTQVEDTGKKPGAITKYRDDKDMDRGHKVVGNAASVPSTKIPKTHPSARHDEGTDAQPSAGSTGGKVIPLHGDHVEQRRHDYAEQTVFDAVADKGAHKRAVTPQIAQHPVAVPANQKNKNS
jgi:hypothetical protein